MRITGREELHKFAAKHPDCRRWVVNWIAHVERVQWRTPQDIKSQYVTASLLNANVVIFNVRGNEYRLVTRVAYQSGVVAVLWVGKHSDYVNRQF